MSRFHKIFIQELGEDLYLDLLAWDKSKKRRLNSSFSFYTANHHFHLELSDMARKKKDGTNGTQQVHTTTSDGPTWVNVRFEQDEIAWIAELVADPNQIGSRLAGLLADNIGFSVKFVPLRGNYSAFVVGVAVPGIGENCAFSAFAPDTITATCAVLCKVALTQASPSRGTASGASVGIG